MLVVECCWFPKNNSPANVVAQEDDLRASITMPRAGSHATCESRLTRTKCSSTCSRNRSENFAVHVNTNQ